MESNEEEIFRLNNKIKELLATIEKTITKNMNLSTENRQLNSDFHALKADYMKTSQLYLQHKLDLGKKADECDALYEALQKLKVKFNSLVEEKQKQNEQIKSMEQMIKCQNNVIQNKLSQTVPNSESISNMPLSSSQKQINLADIVQSLESRLQNTKEELSEAHELIDQLEFELETIDFLELEHVRMEEEITKLRDKIQRLHAERDGQPVVKEDDHQQQQQKPETSSDEVDKTQSSVHRASSSVAMAATATAVDQAEKQMRRQMLIKKLQLIHSRQSQNL